MGKLLYFIPMGVIVLLAACLPSRPGDLTFNIDSTETYEIDMLVTKVISRKNKIYEDYQGRLDVPGAYVFKHVGINGRPSYNPKNGKKSSNNVTLTGSIDFEAMTVRPFTGGVKGRMAGGENLVRIRLKNSGPGRELPGSNYCLTGNEYLQELGGTASRSECDLSRPGLCRIYMPIDGWGVELALDKALYHEPELSCEIVRKFLNEKTINRDNL